MSALCIDRLSKAYRLYPNRWARLAEWILPGSKPRHELKWVLQDISFTVQPGEALGIVGLNGAGKSTLLKMITGTTQPTTGSITTSGRVAALLELGLGFHPEFTGRQNAFMAGQLLGYSNEEIKSSMAQIEAFAQIGDYIDQPVRIYSSGMQMRLAFSVATAIRPDVLIIDEALSVGDAYFQHKSFERIREFQKLGTTLLIVSHDKAAILSICNRAILLNDGKIAMQGKPEAVLDYYNAMLAKNQNLQITQKALPDGQVQTESGSGEASITNISLLSTDYRPLQTVAVGQPILIRIVATINQDIDSLVLGCGVKDRFGQMVFGTNTYHTNQILFELKRNEACIYTISCNANLGVGSYSIHASLVPSHSHIDKNYHWIDNASIFEVLNQDKVEFVGTMWNEMHFHIEKSEINDGIKHTDPVTDPEGYSRTNTDEESMDRDIVVVDIGCRWGFAEKFTRGGYRVYGFDPDTEECNSLSRRYQSNSVSIVPVALAEGDGTRTLHVTQEPACSSLLRPDPKLTEVYPALRCARQVSSIEIEATSLDAWARKSGVPCIDFIKIDTQGSELEILKGATSTLQGVRCLEVEVEFNPIYLDQPLFSDVDQFLRKAGFVLWKLTNQVHYSREGAPETQIGEDAIFYDEKQQIKHPLFGGQLYWANAHYINSDVLSTPESEAQKLRDVTLFTTLGMPDVVSHLVAVT